MRTLIPQTPQASPWGAWAQAAGIARARHRPNHLPRLEPNSASLDRGLSPISFNPWCRPSVSDTSLIGFL